MERRSSSPSRRPARRSRPSPWHRRDVDRAVEAARAALEGAWGKTPTTERSRLLHALADALVANRKELAELEVRNVGKAISSVKAELAPGGGELPLLRLGDRLDRRSLEPDRRLAALLLAEGAGRRRRTDRALELPADDDHVEARAGARGRLHGRPQARLRDSAERAADGRARVRGRLPPGAINVVPGAGKTIGAYLVRHPGVDKIAFTGSTETGGEIMRMASDPIKRITLELGGKSPNVVFADADLADAIPSSVWSIYYSAGQSARRARASWWRSRPTTTSSRSSRMPPGA